MTYPIPSLRADHVCLGVDDMQSIIDWYGRVLGFRLEKRWTVTELPGRELAYIIGPDGFRIELISGGKGPRSPSGADFGEHLSVRGANHLCFHVDDVDEAVAAIETAGAEPFFPPTDYPVGAERRIAFFKDIEGNVIEFAGPLSGH
ncbi:MAG: VOC family protein [Xanthobacteraceae bacterium]|nr:VOC family protein [Xanthobacteraceae bacterium]